MPQKKFWFFFFLIIATTGTITCDFEQLFQKSILERAKEFVKEKSKNLAGFIVKSKHAWYYSSSEGTLLNLYKHLYDHCVKETNKI